MGNYWIGLQSKEDSAGVFEWIDKFIPGPTSTSYRHYADVGEADMSSMLCGLANYTAAYGMSAAVQPWGWMPGDCTIMRPYLCRQACECLKACAQGSRCDTLLSAVAPSRSKASAAAPGSISGRL